MDSALYTAREQSRLSQCFFLFIHTLQAQGPFGAPSENSAFSIPQADVMQPAELNRHAACRRRGQAAGVAGGLARAFRPGSHCRVGIRRGRFTGRRAADAAEQGLDASAQNTRSCSIADAARGIAARMLRRRYRLLHGLGFTRVKVLYLADNFGTDWASKGYPVERSR